MRITLLYFLLFICFLLNADGGYQFLYIDNNPQTSAMGETGNVYSYNFLKNPANSILNNYFYVYANHTEYFLNINMEEFAFVFPTTIGNFGLNIKGLYTDKMLKADNNGIIDSNSFVYINALTNINYSKNIINNLNIGSNVKILYSAVDSFNAFAFLFDIGAMYFINDIYKAGFSINNIAYNLKYINTSYQPIVLRIGNSVKLNDFDAMIDFNYYLSENSMFEFLIGMQYSLADILFLRIGYAFNNKYYLLTDNIRGGLGIKVNGIGIDYSAVFMNTLGLIHNIGISYDYEFIIKRKELVKEKLYMEMEKRLEEKEKMMADIFINKAKSYMEEDDYENALDNIDLALIWHPENKEAKILSSIIEENMEKWKTDQMFEQGVDAYMNKDYMNAMNIFKQIINLNDSEKARDYYNKSLKEYQKTIASSKQKDQLDNAVKYYENGNYIKAYGIFKKLSQNNDIAMQYLNKTIKKINSIVDEKLNYINELYKMKNYISAIKEAKVLLKYSVKTEEINSIIEKINNKLNNEINKNLNKGKELFELKQYKEAEEYFRKVIVVDSTNSEAKQYIEKIKNMNIYSMEDLEKMYLKGIEAYTNNNFRLAIQYWQKCIEINPNYTKAIKNIEKAKKKISELENK